MIAVDTSALAAIVPLTADMAARRQRLHPIRPWPAQGGPELGRLFRLRAGETTPLGVLFVDNDFSATDVELP